MPTSPGLLRAATRRPVFINLLTAATKKEEGQPTQKLRINIRVVVTMDPLTVLEESQT